MIRGVVYSRRAAAEIEEIMTSLVEYSSAAANCFAQAVERAEEQLSRSPIWARLACFPARGGWLSAITSCRIGGAGTMSRFSR